MTTTVYHAPGDARNRAHTGDVRIAATGDERYVYLLKCPFCGLTWSGYGKRWGNHWPECEANDRDPLSVVADG